MGLENANVVVGIVSSNEEHRGILVKLVKKLGAESYVINFGKDNIPFPMMENIDCFLFGDGPPLHPTSYENGDEDLDCFQANKDLDLFEIEVLSKALDCDMPVLGVSRGMHLINVALGGGIEIGLTGHNSVVSNGSESSSFHRIFISPGSKLAATVGSGGFVRVNSRHSEGIKESQKSRDLLSTAWSMEDGLIEAIESPNHNWVLGVQFIPYIRLEIPPHFDRLFDSLIHKAKTTI